MHEVHAYREERMDSLIHSPDLICPRCNTDYYRQWPWFMNIQGPEDGRLIWSRLGEPLMIYNSVSPPESDLCRMLYMVDLRAVYPTINWILEETENVPPIRFPHSVPLIYDGLIGVPKNWAPFTNELGEVFVHTDLIPQRIYKVNLDAEPLPSFHSPANKLAILEPVPFDLAADKRNCVERALNEAGGPYWLEFHQSTPMLEVVLCTSTQIRAGICDPSDPANRVFILIVHVVHRGYEHWELAYEARLITLNSTAPHNYISVSKPLQYCTASW
jgi:hypothetical protein